jgi:hypothetical protein
MHSISRLTWERRWHRGSDIRPGWRWSQHVKPITKTEGCGTACNSAGVDHAAGSRDALTPTITPERTDRRHALPQCSAGRGGFGDRRAGPAAALWSSRADTASPLKPVRLSRGVCSAWRSRAAGVRRRCNLAPFRPGETFGAISKNASASVGGGRRNDAETARRWTARWRSAFVRRVSTPAVPPASLRKLLRGSRCSCGDEHRLTCLDAPGGVRAGREREHPRRASRRASASLPWTTILCGRRT